MPLTPFGDSSRPVDVLDHEVDVSAGEDKQSRGVDRLRMAYAWPGQVAAENRSGRSGEQVRAPSGQLFELGNRFPQRDLGVCQASSRAVQPHLEPTFRFHDLRHYFASLLIASGTDVKVVQARLRHKSAKTTLDTYGHLWPDSDDSTRAAVDGVSASKVDRVADYLRTGGNSP